MHIIPVLSTAATLIAVTLAQLRTEITLGGRYIDYGCEASIQKTLGEAFDKICGSGADCDQSQTYSRDVKWANSDNPVTDKAITVEIDGEIPSDDVRRRLKNALLASVNPTSARPRDVRWDTIGGGIGGCSMSRFSSYVGIVTFDGDDYQHGIDVNIDLEAAESLCDKLETLEEIVGSITGPVADAGGPIFGAITFRMCGLKLGEAN